MHPMNEATSLYIFLLPPYRFFYKPSHCYDIFQKAKLHLGCSVLVQSPKHDENDVMKLYASTTCLSTTTNPPRGLRCVSPPSTLGAPQQRTSVYTKLYASLPSSPLLSCVVQSNQTATRDLDVFFALLRRSWLSSKEQLQGPCPV
jgi:hypothetical protein